MRTVFLDHQSSTPLLPEAFEAMQPYFQTTWGNPSSLHQSGLRARRALDEARTQFAALIGASSAENVLFTSGGTESANLAIKGVAYASQRQGKHVVVSAIEHPAVRNSVAFLEQQGFTCTRVNVDPHGWIQPEAVRSALTDETILVCIHHVNHEVGTIEPIHEIASAVNERGIPLFVDATASAGWLPIHVEDMGISLLSLAAHRFYGPKGVGVLYRDRRVRLTSLLHGGDQEQGRRAGTENVPAIVGGGKAAEVAQRELPARAAHTTSLQRQLWGALSTEVPYLALNGPPLGPQRISTNLNVSAEFTEGEGQLLSLDMAGIAAGSGTSCVSRSIKASPVLQAMGIDPALARASILFTLGKDNTADDVAYAAATYGKVVSRLRNMSPAWEDFQQGTSRALTAPTRHHPGLPAERPAC